MRIIIFLFIMAPLFTCAQEKINHTDASGLRQGLWQKKYPNGRLMYKGEFRNDKPVGEWKRWHETGRLKAILKYSASSDSVKAQLFGDSSDPIAEGYYIGGKKTGLWNFFSNGVKLAEENFIGDKKNGTCRKFYPTGELLEESEWKDDLLEGKTRSFYKSGKPYLECNYKNNQRNGKGITYYPDGSRESDFYYKYDLPDSTWIYYDRTGNTRYILYYKEGKLKNPEVLQKLDSQELEELENKRENLVDPEKFLESPEEFLKRKH